MANDQDQEFREEQKAAAAAQGMTEEDAVPEQRPAAFDQNTAPESPLARRLREADPGPMPKSAYERAASDEQMKKAAKASRTEAIAVADSVEVTDEDSPHFGRQGAVVRAVYSNEAHAQRAGQPEQRFIEADEFEVRAVGDERAPEPMMLRPDQVKRISQSVLGRARV